MSFGRDEDKCLISTIPYPIKKEPWELDFEEFSKDFRRRNSTNFREREKEREKKKAYLGRRFGDCKNASDSLV